MTNTRLFAAIIAVVMASCGGQSERQYLDHAKASLASNDTRNATRQLKAALQLNESSSEGRFLLGQTLLTSGDPAAAIIELQRARELKYPDKLLVPVLARALLAHGEYKQLIGEFSAMALDDTSADVDLTTSVAAAHIAMGQPDLADTALEKALAKKPDFPRALLTRALRKIAAGDFESASALIETATTVEPKNFEASSSFLPYLAM